MKTIWVLAKNRHTVSEALRKSLEDKLAENDFIDFRYIALPFVLKKQEESFS